MFGAIWANVNFEQQLLSIFVKRKRRIFKKDNLKMKNLTSSKINPKHNNKQQISTLTLKNVKEIWN
jgi:hypothetical protein